MRAEVVHHDYMAGAQLRTQHLVEIAEEEFSIGGRFDGQGSQHAVVIHRAQDGEHLPVAARHGVMDAVAAPGPCPGPGHLRRDAAFVEVNQVFRRDRGDLADELFAAFAVGFGVALGGVERLFFNRRPICLSTTAISAMLTRTPSAASSA